jgi:hypothetical protein
MPEITLFQRMFPNAIGNSFREFLFGHDCPYCKRGWGTKRWARYDDTGSWRMHQRGSITFDTYESVYCERNGWFSRHWLTTVFFCFVAFISVVAAISAAFQ